MINIQHRQLVALYDHWDQQRGTRAAPAPDEVFPERLVQLVPYIFFAVPVGDGGDFRFSFAGSRIAEHFAQTIADRMLSQLDLDDHTAEILASYRLAADTMTASCATLEFITHHHRHVKYERLLLPLSYSGRYCDKLLGANSFDFSVWDAA